MGESILKINHLSKTFGSNLVLKDIDFTVDAGDVISIIGASGSGKSTLLRCINLLEIPDAGHVWFHGEDLVEPKTKVDALREKIGMVFQSFNLFNNKNVLDNCTLYDLDRVAKAMNETMNESLHAETVGGNEADDQPEDALAAAYDEKNV